MFTLRKRGHKRIFAWKLCKQILSLDITHTRGVVGWNILYFWYMEGDSRIIGLQMTHTQHCRCRFPTFNQQIVFVALSLMNHVQPSTPCTYKHHQLDKGCYLHNISKHYRLSKRCQSNIDLKENVLEMFSGDYVQVLHVLSKGAETTMFGACTLGDISRWIISREIYQGGNWFPQLFDTIISGSSCCLQAAAPFYISLLLQYFPHSQNGQALL